MSRWMQQFSKSTPLLRSLITLDVCIRRGHHPPAPHASELAPCQGSRRLPRPLPPRPRTRFLPPATRPHFPNLHLRDWIIPANLRIVRASAAPSLVPPARMPPYPDLGFSAEPLPRVRPPFPR